MAEETTYIPYGQNEISQQDLMTNLANGVPGYLDSQRWAKKDKYRQAWIKAYQDIMNRGIVGATNDTGIWQLQHKGDPITLDNMSNVDREMYQDAAYYIQQQMSRMTPRKKEEEAKKDNLDKYDFISQFLPQIYNNRYGGNEKLFASEWENLDARGDNGLRGTDNRKAALIDELTEYKQNLLNNKGKYNFEGTAFKDENDVINKIDEAITAINSRDLTDDNPKLNALGLSYNSFFSNGGNDASTHYDENGKPYTWNQWNESERLKAEAKAKAEEEKTKQKLAQEAANRYGRLRFYGANLFGKPLSPEHSNIQYLQSLAAKDDLNGDEQSELVGVFKLAAKNGALQNVTPEELKRFGANYTSNPNRLKKIRDLEGLYWDTIGNRVIKPYAKGTQPQLQSFQNILNQNNPEWIKQHKQETPISKEGWTSADTADVVSMVGDLVSLGGLWANIGGTATSLTSDLYADISRGKDVGSILNGIFANVGWGLAGMLPGAKSTRIAARAARLIPKAVVLAQSAGIVLDPEIQQSALKFTKPSEYKNITSKDLENLKYLFHAATGSTNIAKSHYRAKQYRETLNKQEVQTKNGTKPLSNKQVKDINKAGRKEGQKAAETKFKEYTGQEAAEGQFKFSENGNSKFNLARYSNVFSKFSSDNKLLKGKQVTDQEALAQIFKQDKERPWYHWNKGYPKVDLMFTSKENIKRASEKKQQPKNTPPLNKEKVQKYLKNNEQKALPAPGNTNIRGEVTNSGTRPQKSYSIRQNQQEVNNFVDSYGLNSKRGNRPTAGGYDPNRKLDDGVYRSGDIIFDKKNGKISVTFGKQKKEFTNLASARRYLAESINNSELKKKEISKTAEVLRDLKRLGIFKQGGQVQTLDKIIEDFVNNNNI